MIGDGWSLRMAKPYKEMGRYGGVGIDLVLAILLLGALGHWLDGRYFAPHDYAMLGGGFLGVAVGVRSLVRAAKRMQRDIEVAEAEDPAGSRWTVDETWVHKDVDDAAGHPPHAKPRSPSSPE
jgi:Putative F0F1-ATPase subunit Ca2+/Mg2+ transporter